MSYCSELCSWRYRYRLNVLRSWEEYGEYNCCILFHIRTSREKIHLNADAGDRIDSVRTPGAYPSTLIYHWSNFKLLPHYTTISPKCTSLGQVVVFHALLSVIFLVSNRDSTENESEATAVVALLHYCTRYNQLLCFCRWYIRKFNYSKPVDFLIISKTLQLQQTGDTLWFFIGLFATLLTKPTNGLMIHFAESTEWMVTGWMIAGWAITGGRCRNAEKWLLTWRNMQMPQRFLHALGICRYWKHIPHTAHSFPMTNMITKQKLNC